MCAGKYGLKQEWTEFKAAHTTPSGDSVFIPHQDNGWDLTINFSDNTPSVLLFNRSKNSGAQLLGWG